MRNLGEDFVERARARGAALARFPLVSAEPLRAAYIDGWVDGAREGGVAEARADDRCQSCGAPTGTHDEGCRENPEGRES